MLHRCLKPFQVRGFSFFRRSRLGPEGTPFPHPPTEQALRPAPVMMALASVLPVAYASQSRRCVLVISVTLVVPNPIVTAAPDRGGRDTIYCVRTTTARHVGTVGSKCNIGIDTVASPRGAGSPTMNTALECCWLVVLQHNLPILFKIRLHCLANPMHHRIGAFQQCLCYCNLIEMAAILA
jgi:hypothetical protein